jgi:hypothetical protein
VYDFDSWFGNNDIEINAASNRGRMSDFEKLNSENVREEAGQGILVLPVGSVEQHGPHLPLTVDTEIRVRIATTVAGKMKGFVAPVGDIVETDCARVSMGESASRRNPYPAFS